MIARQIENAAGIIVEQWSVLLQVLKVTALEPLRTMHPSTFDEKRLIACSYYSSSLSASDAPFTLTMLNQLCLMRLHFKQSNELYLLG